MMNSKCWEDACFMLGHQKTFAKWWMSLLLQLVGSCFYLVYTMCFKPIPKSINSVQLLSCVRLFATPWTTAYQASLSITSSQSLPKLMSIESVIPFRHLIFFRPLLLLPPILPSIRVFSNESILCMRWPKYWGFRFNNYPSNEHSGLSSFRMDWLDLLVVQGTLKSLLQHHNSKAETLLCQQRSI